MLQGEHGIPGNKGEPGLPGPTTYIPGDHEVKYIRPVGNLFSKSKVNWIIVVSIWINIIYTWFLVINNNNNKMDLYIWINQKSTDFVVLIEM